MKTISIRHYRTGEIIFSTHSTSLKQATERAVRDNVSLAGADLRHTNLVNAELDGAVLDDAQMNESNLMGANLSEASLYRSVLTNAQLCNTTLCEAKLENVTALGALFGGTDISGAAISHCAFDTFSALDLNFCDAAILKDNRFIASNDFLCRFTQPPLTLKGLPFQLTCFDHALLVGHHALTDLPAIRSAGLSSALFTFITEHRTLINSLWESRADSGIQAA